ncbi:hypothetical protein CCR97_18630 [Rhodoplanes elegans]|uniref:Uncharacterized protein n=1 Tax=Rhodoplanes elegans TaxID=29408 RepID=A0A327KIZ6_9BRAD|nr:hypothetical protein [Rhodoplanes elegans]MBK5960202.1 hypothetical protein [Rhodoplanes elegans]RAI38091.1 hypothetical protein CH338_13850 [Rhodoplanes elegans]
MITRRMLNRPAGLYWAKIDHNGTGPAPDITVVDVDDDGDVRAIGYPDTIDPAKVTWLGLAVPPAALERR